MNPASPPQARGRLQIDHTAVAGNFQQLARQCGSGGCAAVVKANAYGLGIDPIARTLFDAGCRQFFVADANEGLELRPIVPDAQILLLDGLSSADPASLLEHRLTPVLTCPAQAQRWRLGGGSFQVWQIDTGMNRLGMTLEAATGLAQDTGPPDLILSHFACADEPQHPSHQRQLQALNALRMAFPQVSFSLGNTAGVQLPDHPGTDHGRCGIGLFGINPAPQPALSLTFALGLQGRVLQQRQVPEGGAVGYGSRWKAPGVSELLTVALGYADGLPRLWSNRATFQACGKPLPVVGRISMDYTVVDATGLTPDERATLTWVDVFDSAPGLEQLALAADTISYEILTGLGKRIQRCHQRRQSDIKATP